MLDVKIETFLAVCKYMNYTKAANELHLTQSAVSQQIASLESYYNTKLFIYSNRSLSLTKAGEYLRNAMESIYHDSMEIRDIITNNLDLPTIRIGATMTIGNYFLPKYLIPYIKKHETASLDINIYDTKEVLDLLNEGKIDLAFIEGMFKKQEYDEQIISTEKLLLVCGSNFDTSGIKTLNDIFNYPLVIRENGSGTRSFFDSLLCKNGYNISSFKTVIQANSIYLIKEILTNDYGISFLYESAVRDEIENNTIKVIDIPNVSISYHYTAIWKKNSIFQDVYKKLLKEIIRYSN